MIRPLAVTTLVVGYDGTLADEPACSHRPHGGHLRRVLDDDATAERERSVRCGTRVVLSGLHELPDVLLPPLARP